MEAGSEKIGREISASRDYGAESSGQMAV